MHYTISYLADHPEFIDTLAPWITRHWQPLVTDETLVARIEKLSAHLQYTTLPLAMAAHDNSMVLGTAALRRHDLPGREDLTPWLGGVFVGEAYRNRGVGRALCAAIETTARCVFQISTLYLFTIDKTQWYLRSGWEILEPCQWQGVTGNIMVKSLGTVSQ